MSANGVGSCLFQVDSELSGRILQPVLGARVPYSEHSKGADNRNDCDRHDHLDDREATLFCLVATVAFHLASTSEGTHLAEDKLRPCPLPLATRMPLTNPHELLWFLANTARELISGDRYSLPKVTATEVQFPV